MPASPATPTIASADFPTPSNIRTITRCTRGRRVSFGGRDHISHRLVLIGMNDATAVAVLYAVAMASGGSLLLWKSVSSRFGGGMLAIFLLGACLLGFHLIRLRIPESCLSARRVASISIPNPVLSFLRVFCPAVIDAGLVFVSLYLLFLRISGDQFSLSDSGFLLACGGSALAAMSVLAIRRNYGKHPVSAELNSSIWRNGLFTAASTAMLLLLIFPWKRFPAIAIPLGAVLSSSLLVIRQWVSGFFEQFSPIDADPAIKDDEPVDVALAK